MKYGALCMKKELIHLIIFLFKILLSLNQVSGSVVYVIIAAWGVKSLNGDDL